VWRWLAKHPDVHVGKDREGNKMSLSALEAQYLNKEAAATLETARHSSTSSSLLGRHGQEPQMPPDSSPFSYATATNALRVYVSEERAWFAICGHSKDSAKVFDTEFVLLSIIAAHREAGILQGDLVKQSGQDKRSVPKRTDLLRSKGYIEKRIVQLKGLKTSRLILRRFASNGINDMITPVSVPVGPHGNVHNESVDFNVLIQRLFALLKKKQIITRDDLKNELEMKNKWRARVLAKVVRKFEVVGCLKRVKAASEASKKARYYFYCVKLIHEPSEGDMDAFYSSDAILNAEHAVEEPDLDDEDDADKDKAMVEQSLGIEGNELEEVDRIVPQWNPDRSVANVLLNLVERAGTQGLANRVGGL
jgi:predicted transcriptional regulator